MNTCTHECNRSTETRRMFLDKNRHYCRASNILMSAHVTHQLRSESELRISISPSSSKITNFSKLHSMLQDKDLHDCTMSTFSISGYVIQGWGQLSIVLVQTFDCYYGIDSYVRPFYEVLLLISGQYECIHCCQLKSKCRQPTCQNQPTSRQKSGDRLGVRHMVFHSLERSEWRFWFV